MLRRRRLLPELPFDESPAKNLTSIYLLVPFSLNLHKPFPFFLVPFSPLFNLIQYGKPSLFILFFLPFLEVLDFNFRRTETVKTATGPTA